LRFIAFGSLIRIEVIAATRLILEEVLLMMKRYGWMLFPAIGALAVAAPVWAQEDQEAALAKKLANPIASLISVPPVRR